MEMHSNTPEKSTPDCRTGEKLEENSKIGEQKSSLETKGDNLELNESVQIQCNTESVKDEHFDVENNTRFSNNECLGPITYNSVQKQESKNSRTPVRESKIEAEILNNRNLETEELQHTNKDDKTCENMSKTFVLESNDVKDDLFGKEEDKHSVVGDCSQATTVDIAFLDGRGRMSPEDLFASQTQEISGENLKGSPMESEDFIPSSFIEESGNSVSGREVDDDNSKNSSPKKRKLEEDSETINNFKVPKLDLKITSDSDMSGTSFSEETTVQEVTPENVKSQIKERNDDNLRTVKEVNCNVEHENVCKEQENDITSPQITVREDKSKECNDGAFTSDSETSKNSRKSLEIVFSSYDKSNNILPSQNVQNLPTVPEENGEQSDDEQEDSFCLRISMSPSQVTHSFSDIDSQSEANLSMKTNSHENSNSVDTKDCNDLRNCHGTSSHHSDTNIHCTKESQKSIPDTITIDDNSDVHMASPDGKVASDEVEILEKSVPKVDSDSDVTVILDKSDEKRLSSNSENFKHSDINGTILKSKSAELVRDTDKTEFDRRGESAEVDCLVDMNKQAGLSNLAPEFRSTPDLPLRVQNKDLRVVKRTYALHVRLHLNDNLHQVQSIEMAQCQSMEEFLKVVKTSNKFECSDGSVADESKSSSPSSVTSLGPFALKPHNRYSSSSTSTSSSGQSILGLKSKSDDWQFAAPMNRAPSRNNRLRNIQYSQEFERELYELAERAFYYDDDVESKIKLLLNRNDVTPVIATPDTTAETKGVPQPNTGSHESPDGAKETSQTNGESQEDLRETPKSTKKYSRSKNVRSNSRTVDPDIKEVKEQDPLQTPTKNGESQRRTRKPPSRSSKRSATSTPNPTSGEDAKTSTPVASSVNRSRRVRNEVFQPEETDSSSQDPISDWNAEACFTKLIAEAPVFARWTDKKYYPGRVKEKMKDGRWVIEFDDKTVRPLREEYIIPINILTKGQIVFAFEGDEYEQGIIVEFKLKNGEVHYGVDLDSGRKLFVPRSKLFMSEDQARLLQENMDPKSPTTSSPAITTVTCDNIVHHKRPRSTRVLFGNASPSVSGVSKTAKRPSHDNSCSSSVSDYNEKGQTLNLDDVSGVDPEVPSSFPEALRTASGRGKGPGRIKSKSRTPRRNATVAYNLAENQENNKLSDILGPIPEKGSKIFSGKCFLLSHSDVNHKTYTDFEQSSNRESDGSDIHTDDNASQMGIPFVKDHLILQLEAGGGIVYENFEDVPEDEYQNCVLITDRPCLTAKYILCLANGINIFGHKWVIEVVKGSNCHVNSSRFPRGWNLEERCWVDANAGTRSRKTKPLNKKEVGIVNESQTFVKFWERILELLGANVRQISPGSRDQDRQFEGADVIVTDSTCPPEVQDRAREWSIPLVSTVWITQTLIVGKIRSYTHPHYRFDYCGSD